MTNLIFEGKECQELIRIADKSADGWTVVDEYASDELASGSEEQLKKAKDAAKRKRRQAMQGHHGPEKRTKTSLSSTDQQLFCGEPTFSIVSICFCASSNCCFSCDAIIFQNPTENLVSSNVRLSNNLTFHHV